MHDEDPVLKRPGEGLEHWAAEIADAGLEYVFPFAASKKEALTNHSDDILKKAEI